jgi:uncharacterized protein (TIGR02265 family)
MLSHSTQGKAAQALGHYRYNATAIETHLKAWNLEEDTEFLKSLLPYGYDYRRVAKSYSFDCIVLVDRAIMAKCLPGTPEEQAAMEMGRHFYDGLSLTVLGRVLTASFKLMSVERALATAVANFNRVTGFGERHLEYIGPKHYLVVASDDPGATYTITRHIWAGIYQRLLEKFKVEQLSVQAFPPIESLPLSFSIELKWQ